MRKPELERGFLPSHRSVLQEVGRQDDQKLFTPAREGFLRVLSLFYPGFNTTEISLRPSFTVDQLVHLWKKFQNVCKQKQICRGTSTCGQRKTYQFRYVICCLRLASTVAILMVAWFCLGGRGVGGNRNMAVI